MAPFFQRRDRDSNPGTSKLVNGFRDRPDRPLRHLSSGFLRVQKYYFFTIWPNLFYKTLTSTRIESSATMAFWYSAIACCSNISGSR